MLNTELREEDADDMDNLIRRRNFIRQKEENKFYIICKFILTYLIHAWRVEEYLIPFSKNSCLCRIYTCMCSYFYI